MAKKSKSRKQERVSGAVAFQEPWISELFLLWSHILSKDQHVVEEDGLPSLVLLEDLIRHGQVATRKSSPEIINSFCSDCLLYYGVERKLTKASSARYHDGITNSQLNVIFAREVIKFLHQAKKILSAKITNVSKTRTTIWADENEMTLERLRWNIQVTQNYKPLNPSPA